MAHDADFPFVHLKTVAITAFWRRAWACRLKLRSAYDVKVGPSVGIFAHAACISARLSAEAVNSGVASVASLQS
ncbi:hypothetical protein [Methylocystis silviterrae]|uniref:hypothetical protein n=1 Tax=Methylocystis silviterrae TaxID=2743612 RepID=UPI003C7263B2